MAQATTNATPPQTAPALSFGAHIADPGPLGLAGFALTTFMLSSFNSGLAPKSAEVVVLGVALFYGGIAQLLAGMWEFAKGNTFGATAFASYGGFWLSFWYLTGHTNLSGLPAGDVDKTIGWYLISWGIFTAYMSVAATRVNLAVLTVFVLLTLTFLVLGWGAMAGKTGITHLGGYLGLLTALAAWYASFAGVTAFTFKRQVLPVGPR